MSLREVRLRRGWSQEQLAAASGVSVRTIQRIEGGQAPSPFTVRALAVALDVDPRAVGEPSPEATSPEATSHGAQPDDAGPAAAVTFREALERGARGWGDFDGRASRSEFWYAALAVLVVVGALAAIDERLGAASLVLALVPLGAVGTRRLRDADQSPWWLLFALVPMGFVVLATLMALPGTAREAVPATRDSH